MSDAAPNDPAVVTDLTTSLQALVTEFNGFVSDWAERVDEVVVRLQNAGSATVTPDGSVTGSVPEQGPGSPPSPVDTTGTTQPDQSTVPTGSSTTPEPSTPPEDTGTTGFTHNFSDPSGDDTISDPSGDDVNL